MIGTKYTSGMLAAFAKSPCLRRMDVKVEPDGGGCATTVFDAEDRELAAYEETVDLDNVRFGFAVGRCVARVAVRRHAASDALQAVFRSFYEHETSDDPWLRICEPAGE